MDLWTFISKVIASLSWPIVAIVVLCCFRKPLKNLINKIREVHWAGCKVLADVKEEENFKLEAFDTTEGDSKLADESTKLLAYYAGFLSISLKEVGSCSHIQSRSAQTFHNAYRILQKRIPESEDIKNFKNMAEQLGRGD